ncbi:hypothetical protein SARC_04213 [Sphaeroforma arctica JP610]|uniref:FYVE-type domain-containing protein n=1 Tax=Sphaeroforma arctica JP610 TaxID=667725 RepID=A0A0L0G385_9EUKA|nr:hypothetical protein SARC_04213 [Sphaeroforma arctica JP610]KNC83540.1 hypothetical protein SARC_04213 [Sphaeroforma arctica JP610]|eukprot:XP_014157442.1 hypothetical protein SARC_04213 [Sphaeroforma arctica JP610]
MAALLRWWSGDPETVDPPEIDTPHTALFGPSHDTQNTLDTDRLATPEIPSIHPPKHTRVRDEDAISSNSGGSLLNSSGNTKSYGAVNKDDEAIERSNALAVPGLKIPTAHPPSSYTPSNSASKRFFHQHNSDSTERSATTAAGCTKSTSHGEKNTSGLLKPETSVKSLARSHDAAHTLADNVRDMHSEESDTSYSETEPNSADLQRADSGYGLRLHDGAVHKLALELPERVVQAKGALKGQIHIENWAVLSRESQLILSIEGTEHARLKTKGITKTLSLIDFKCIAYSGENVLVPGTHVIPFTFRVPDLPATCARETAPFRAAICYNLTAQFVGLENQGPLTRSQIFIVTHNTDDDDKDPKETIRHINTNGDYALECWLARNRFTTADVVALKLRLNSTAIKAVHGIHVVLKNTMTLRMEGYRIRHEEVSLHQDYGGFEPCFYGERFISFSIGRLDCYTTKGTMLQSTFALQVSLLDRKRKVLIGVTLPINVVPAESPAQLVEDNTDAERSFRPNWQMDKDAPRCNDCQKRFHLIFCALPRRHHCRHCGLVFCGSCCKKFMVVPNLGYYHPVRVCNICVNEVELGGRKYVGTLRYRNTSGNQLTKRIRTLSEHSGYS